MHSVHGYGPVLDPMLVAPAISVWVSPKAGIVPLTSKSFTIHVQVRSDVEGPASGTVSLKLPKGWTSNPAQAQFAIQQNGGQQNIEFEVVPRSSRGQAVPHHRRRVIPGAHLHLRVNFGRISGPAFLSVLSRCGLSNDRGRYPNSVWVDRGLRCGNRR